jgi:2-C-methyl-D-erythritol 2,4-cyclodiphosphate synthase
MRCWVPRSRGPGRALPCGRPKWKHASSVELLKRIAALLGQRGARVENVDVMLVAEAPKLAPHRAEMCANIAAAIGIAPDRVSVKATTNETLGAIGRREGLAAFAVALVER